MILTYMDGDNPYFLDATGRYSTLELPTSFIQGKEALVAKNEDTYVVMEVPTVPAVKNLFHDHSKITLENGVLKGVGESEIFGNQKKAAFYSLERTDNTHSTKQFYNQFFRKGNNSFQFLNLTEKNKFAYDKPLGVAYTFSISDYYKEIAGSIYLNLNLNKKVLEYSIDKKRELPFVFKYLEAFNLELELEIPAGYRLEYLPNAFECHNALLTGSISYNQEGNKVLYRQKLQTSHLVINPDQLPLMRETVKKFEKAYKEVLIFEKE